MRTILLITKNNIPLFTGNCNYDDGLYDIQLNKNEKITQQNKINYVISQEKSKTELAQYFHAAAYSPSISTFQKAIRNGNFITWPGIDTINFHKFIKTTRETEHGHLDQERKNLHSIKQNDGLRQGRSNGTIFIKLSGHVL